MKKFAIFAAICATLTVGSVTYAGNVAQAEKVVDVKIDQADQLFYEFNILFTETVKIQRDLQKDPSLQWKYDYLIKRLNEIKVEHAKVTGVK